MNISLRHEGSVIRMDYVVEVAVITIEQCLAYHEYDVVPANRIVFG